METEQRDQTTAPSTSNPTGFPCDFDGVVTQRTVVPGCCLRQVGGDQIRRFRLTTASQPHFHTVGFFSLFYGDFLWKNHSASLPVSSYTQSKGQPASARSLFGPEKRYVETWYSLIKHHPLLHSLCPSGDSAPDFYYWCCCNKHSRISLLWSLPVVIR